MTKLRREQLGVKPGDEIIVKGIVSFARMDKLIEGEALARENERRQKLGMTPSKPFRSITIEEPTIVKGGNTPLAQFYGQTVYTSKTSGKQAMSLESKSLYAPAFGHLQEQNGQNVIVPMEDPQKNPAPGQVVYIKIQAYQPKGYSNLGSSFTEIVYEKGEIAFYQGASLSGFGEVLNAEVKNAPAQPTAPVQNVQPQVQNAGFGQAPVQPEVAPTAAPTNDPFGTSTGTPTNDPFGAPTNDPFGQPVQNSNPYGNGPSSSPFA